MNAFLTTKSIEHWVRDIHSWILNDYQDDPKLKNNKTEYFIIRTPQKGKIEYLSVLVLLTWTSNLCPSLTVKSLRLVWFQAVYANTRHKCVDLFIFTTINSQQRSSNTTRIGLYNSFLNVSAVYFIPKLQRIKNAWARRIFREQKFCHVKSLSF